MVCQNCEKNNNPACPDCEKFPGNPTTTVPGCVVRYVVPGSQDDTITERIARLEQDVHDIKNQIQVLYLQRKPAGICQPNDADCMMCPDVKGCEQFRKWKDRG